MKEQELEHLIRFVVQYIFEKDTGTIDSEFASLKWRRGGAPAKPVA